MNYSFSTLNDKEFERLSIDLLSSLHNVRIERFKDGKDAGVDGRFFSHNNGECIIQCKHFLKTGYKGLLQKLKKEEFIKVKNLNPKKYIFVTSLPLSRKNKQDIKKIFNPYIKNENDILGQEDLNDLLSKNQKIEEKYYKLWISSTNVFNRFINNAIEGRSKCKLQLIQKNAHKYVETANHKKALKTLKESRTIILSGEPGIGKTTLAENLCLYYVSKGYGFYSIENYLNEAENIWEPGKKQIFYYDDFLGGHLLEALENKKDSHIMQFIERVRQDKTKRFVLTSRTNIINQAIPISDIFKNNNIRRDELLLTVEKLSELDKAKILYNHIWFSSLKEECVDEIYKNKRYKKIIEHRNFNPRTIEFITDNEKFESEHADHSEYWNYIDNKLNHPKDIWENCFKFQSDEFVRNLVLLTTFNDRAISEDDLRKSFDYLNGLENIKNKSHIEKDFNSISKIATKSFLTRNSFNGNISYSLFNQSIADFVLSEYSSNTKKIINVLRSLDSVQSLKHLIYMQTGNLKTKTKTLITRKSAQEIKEALFFDLRARKKNFDYLIFILSIFIGDKNKKSQIIENLKYVITIDDGQPDKVTELIRLLDLLTYYFNDLNIKDYSFLFNIVKNIKIDDEISDFATFLETFKIDDQKTLDKFKEKIEEYLQEELDNYSNEIDLSKIVEITNWSNGEEEVDYDLSDIVDELFIFVENLIGNFNSKIINQLNINIGDIVEKIDIENLIKNYVDSQYEPDFDDDRYHTSDSSDDIDDLFERS